MQVITKEDASIITERRETFTELRTSPSVLDTLPQVRLISGQEEGTTQASQSYQENTYDSTFPKHTPIGQGPIDIWKDTVTIGRSPSNDLVMSQHTVSRKHAVISRDGDRYFVTDVGSRNGTYVNQRKISGSVPIAAGDHIWFGPEVQFVFITNADKNTEQKSNVAAVFDTKSSTWEGTKYKNEDGTFRQEDSLWISPDMVVSVVADGMGGMGGGDIASRIVVEAVERQYPHYPAAGSEEEILFWMREAIYTAHELVLTAQVLGFYDSIHGQRLISEKTPQMASTVVMSARAGDRLLVCWAGDSRAYRLHEGVFTQLTADQELPNKLLWSGVGAQVHLGFCSTAVSCGDRFLLASDGLESIYPQDMQYILANSGSAEEASANLIERVKAAAMPGQDNVAVIVINNSV